MTQKGRVVWRRIGPAVSKNPEFDPAPVFDPATGETHFLTDLPLLLLETVVESPGTTEDLITALAGPVELDDAEAGRITAALHLLEDAELIESVQQPTD